MTAGRLRDRPKAPARASLIPLALIATLAGCGQGGTGHTPDLARLPLVPGTRIVAQAQRCDQGANAFCAVELVVVDPRYKTSDAFLLGEHDRLIRLGWTGANADTGEERAAQSPRHKLRLTYATAYGDLKGIDLGWIHRSRKITLALSRALFEHSSALSLLLEKGSS